VAETLTCDVLILGSGGAGLLAALHAIDRDPSLRVVLASKGLVGKSGCTRMVQGGYNAVLDPADSVERHFVDTLKGGGFLNDQDLAWTLVNDAPRMIHELETKVGCFFDRRPDGRIHQKPFAGQSFDRTVHRGDLTGIEIVGRLRDQLFARPIRVLEETRALDLVPGASGDRIVGAVLLDARRGRFVFAHARAVVLATGGGTRMYKIAAPSLEKTGDGMAMAYRAGARFVDMEMFQFHPTGLLAGASRMSGMVLEEGLRGAGGYLTNAGGERFMARYDPARMERSTRDVVARAGYLEIMAGRGTPEGGVLLDVSHLGAAVVQRQFPGMVERCRDFGMDLCREPVPVSPTAHFHMGGVAIDVDCRSNLEGLFVAGEDAGGVHGANRLGGNGVAESTVFGARAGDAVVAYCAGTERVAPGPGFVSEVERAATAPLAAASGESAAPLRQALETLMWEKVGVVRNGSDLAAAIKALAELAERARRVTAPGGPRLNLALADALDLRNMLLVAEMTARSALVREESRGSHARTDFPEPDDERWLRNVVLQRSGDDMRLDTRSVRLTRLSPLQEAMA
jgi:succinate dehydrogenase/fumarate reductase flavoprotein subunit